MEQYEQSASPPLTTGIDTSESDTRSDIVRLEKMIADQNQQMQKLIKEIHRLKTKLDAHAATINRMNRG